MAVDFTRTWRCIAGRNEPHQKGGMYSELECGICYRTYNAGRRCPRELHCKHSFCESCLLALSRPLAPGEARPGADRLIACPLCRQTTSVSGEGTMRAALRVDRCVLGRLLAAGGLDREEEEEDDEPEEEDGRAPDGCDEDDEGATLPDARGEEGGSSAGSGGGKLRRTWKKVWRKVSGKNLRQSGGENCMTNDDLRNLAMMSCYMF
ncbi:E3 ubiquitin-protein ligase-like isoform X2 [Xiphias gladius]|uniref:E3 ubiquitin-protein ligase-like isoform X2 n=1 Tax=Xiphias gladius TaxID=8245 RepID=UPI001A99BD58|nr:E3 ubiquitin-protein ligase-like isoform X2 [Xiphias gladius]